MNADDTNDTPEAVLCLHADKAKALPIDAIGAAVTRANAILDMVHNQLDGGGGTVTESVLANAVWAAQGIISEIQLLADGHWEYLNQDKRARGV